MEDPRVLERQALAVLDALEPHGMRGVGLGLIRRSRADQGVDADVGGEHRAVALDDELADPDRDRLGRRGRERELRGAPRLVDR